LTNTDYDRIRNIIRALKNKNLPNRDQIYEFETELNFANITDSENIPTNIITLNTKVKIKNISTDNGFVYSIVLPKDANIKEGKISILAPLGLALIGHEAGSIVKYKTEAGVYDYFIEEILYQPESKGIYTL